jgi:solute carrier family 25 (mitochondrial carnitine/acylcarnitine transporter), member 20/29
MKSKYRKRYEFPPTPFTKLNFNAIQVNITVGKLMKGSKLSTMEDLIRRANMTWVLGDSNLAGTGYTVLCPTDKAFTRVNLTRYLNDPFELYSLVSQHIILPSSISHSSAGPSAEEDESFPIGIKEDKAFKTVLSQTKNDKYRNGDLTFRFWEGTWMVGIKGARGSKETDGAKIIAHGRTNPRVVGGGVFEIDNVLQPYQPSFFWRFGIVILWTMIILIAIALGGWGLWRSGYLDRFEWFSKRNGYQAVPQTVLSEDDREATAGPSTV